MNVIAKTNDGYILSATQKELEAIFSAVSKPVTKDNAIGIGDKIPAYDYAAIIEKCKSVKDSYDFKQLRDKTAALSSSVSEYVSSIESLTFED